MRKLHAFAEYLQNERRYSIHTITAYTNDVKQFFCFVENQYGEAAVNDVRAMMAKAWIYLQSQQKSSPRSINRKLTALNTYYKFLLRNEWIESNPLASLQGIKTQKRLYQWLTQEGTNYLFDGADMLFPGGFGGLRDKLILSLLYGTGMRLAELISLQHSSFNLHDGVVKVIGKRNKERIIPVPKEVISTLYIYIEQKMLHGFGEEKYLLVTDKGKPLYPMFVNRCVKKYISAVSSVQKNSPHTLRHSYATHLLNNGADINAIKELLGHASLAATQIYTHNSIERLKTIYKQAHPKG